MTYVNPHPSLAYRSSAAVGVMLAVIVFGARNAVAEEPVQPAADENTQAAAAEPVPDSGVTDTWKWAVGLGAMNGPRFPGSKDYFTHVSPVASLEYGRFFLGGGSGPGSPVGLGAYLLRDDHWQLGVGIGGTGRKPRQASDAPILYGWGDIKRTERGSVFANYVDGWFVVHGGVSADIGGNHEGVEVSFSVLARLHPTERLTLSFGPELKWVDTDYSRTFFGIDAAQSTISGAPQYVARSGINTVGGMLAGEYRATPRWSVGARGSYGRLQGDAADSPVTADKTQYSIGAFVTYHFGKADH